MKTSKQILIATVLVLLVGLSSGVSAQSNVRSDFRLPPEPIQPITKLNAIEITDGTIGIDSQTSSETMFGYSFLGNTTGAYPGSFTFSMNCAPAIPVPGETSAVNGGSWALPVYTPGLRGSTYAGSLYGTIAKGTMNWDKSVAGEGLKAEVYLLFNIDGGTQQWDGAKGFATFTGTLYYDAKADKTTLTGDLVFTIFSLKLDK